MDFVEVMYVVKRGDCKAYTAIHMSRQLYDLLNLMRGDEDCPALDFSGILCDSNEPIRHPEIVSCVPYTHLATATALHYRCNVWDSEIRDGANLMSHFSSHVYSNAYAVSTAFLHETCSKTFKKWDYYAYKLKPDDT